ncbi:MAG: NAD-dependent epimerase/dehydratase family protein [Pseudomonadota bacterium]|nr:NAD-dependent epimerase/dehydratase family protein [Pseudomonadota bacterium]
MTISDLLRDEYETARAGVGDALGALHGRRILITGATGLIGGWLVDFLAYMNAAHGLGVDVFAVSRSAEKLAHRFGGATEKLHFIECDLAGGNIPDGTFDFVVHAASPACPAAYTARPVDVIRANVLGTMVILDAVCTNDTRFLFVSSGEVYGHNKSATPFIETDVGEIQFATVRACYPESKRTAETLCMAYAAQYGRHICIVRPNYVYGPRIAPENNRADAQFLRAVMSGHDIILNSDGAQRRTWCYVADAGVAILRAMLCGADGAIYNIANPNAVASVREFADCMAQCGGVAVQIAPNATAVVGADSVLSADRLIQAGWTPVYDFQSGVGRTIAIAKTE